jgi:hypothetical protein
MSTAAMKQALEALESVRPQNMGPLIYPAIEALRAALAAAPPQVPQGEPVAWFCGEPGNMREVEHWAEGAFPVYAAAPPQVQPKPAAWMGGDGHPKHLLHIQSVAERKLYGPRKPMYLSVPPPTLSDEQISILRKMIDHYGDDERVDCLRQLIDIGQQESGNGR